MSELLKNLFSEPEYQKRYNCFSGSVVAEAEQLGVTVSVTNVYDDLINHCIDTGEFSSVHDAIQPLLDAIAIKKGIPLDAVEHDFQDLADEADALSSMMIRALVVVKVPLDPEDHMYDILDETIHVVEQSAQENSGTPLDMWLELQQERDTIYMRLFEFTDDD